MGRLQVKFHRTLVHPISKWVGSAVDGLSGRGKKRRYQSLEAALSATCEQRDRLQDEIQDLIQYTDTELLHLKQANEQLHRERDALQLQVWTLEEQIKALTQLSDDGALEDASVLILDASTQDNIQEQLQAPEKAHSAAAAIQSGDLPLVGLGYPSIDLSGLRLALVGGHPTTRRGVIQELQLNYGLRHWVEVPRMNEVNTNRSKVKSKIGQCTLVVLITGYMSHRLTEIIFSLKEAGSLAGEVLQLNCKGKSGVVREILNHVEHVGG
ncbi:MAG: hypothetical protein AAGA75_02890 [Cyanobacteria bacterium P01_E01_bin.6]